MDLMDFLQSQISDGMLDQISQQVGVQDKQQTKVATEGILNTLVGALAKNARDENGAAAINKALETDHDGSILEDAMGFLTGQRQPSNPRMTNGSGILKHLLGNNQSSAVDMISQVAGLSNDKTGNLMSMLAPIVMGALGKQKREAGLDIGGIASLLTNTAAGQRQKQAQNPAMTMITSFLDKDGDGSIVDDIAGSVGKGLLSKLFGGRR